MVRTLLAAAAAFALFAGTPARACEDCKNCPHAKMASADDKAGKDTADKLPACKCAGEGKECKCGEKCQCPHCSAKHKAAEKTEPKKT